MSFANDSFKRSKVAGSYPLGFFAAYSLEANSTNEKNIIIGIKGHRKKSQVARRRFDNWNNDLINGSK